MVKIQKKIKIRKKLLRMIEKSSPGDQIIPELTLAEKYNVSQATVRRAIRQFVDDGLLVRIQGSGTFVNDPSKEEYTSFPGIDTFRYDGDHPSYKEPEDTVSLRLALNANEKQQEYEEIIRTYQQQHSKVRIKPDFSQSKNGIPDYFHEIEKGYSPDIFLISKRHMFWFLKKNYIQPLDKYIFGKHPFPVESIEPEVKKSISYQEKTWILPRNMHVFYLCYNKKLFDEQQIPYPDESWDWFKFQEVSRALTKNLKNGRKQYGSYIDLGYLHLAPILWSFGTDFVDAEGRVLLTNEKTVDALRFLTDLAVKYRIFPSFRPADFKNPIEKSHDIDKLFLSGRLAMRLAAGMAFINYISNNNKSEWDIALIPRGSFGRFSPAMYSGWAMSSQTEYPEECGELLKCLAGPESVNRFEDMPALNTEKTLKNFFMAENGINRFQLMAMKNYIKDFPFCGRFWIFLADHVMKLLNDLYLKVKPFDKVIAENQEQMQKSMDEFMKYEKE